MRVDVYVFLAEGFEEVEAITTIDYIRRAGLVVKTVAVGESLELAGAHHIPVIADCMLTEVELDQAKAYVLPGGLPGVTNLNASDLLKKTLLQANEEGKLLAAICAAPMILGQLSLLEGKSAICYPSFEEYLLGANLSEEKVVLDGNVITAKAAGCTTEFALEIITYLTGSKDKSEEILQGLYYK